MELEDPMSALENRANRPPVASQMELEDPMSALENVVERLAQAVGIDKSDYVRHTSVAPELESLIFVEPTCIVKLVMNGYALQHIAKSSNFVLEFILAIDNWCRDEKEEQGHEWVWLTPEYPRYNIEDDKTTFVMLPTNGRDVPCDELREKVLLDFEALFKPRLTRIINAFLTNHYYGYGLYSALFEAGREGFLAEDELHELVRAQLNNFLLLYGILPKEDKEHPIKARNEKEFMNAQAHKRKKRNEKRTELALRANRPASLARVLPA